MNISIFQQIYDTKKGLLIGHFNLIIKYGGYAGKSLGEKYGVSIIQSHTHKIGSHIRKQHNGIIETYENGCLTQLYQNYLLSTDWNHGFSIMEWYNDLFFIHQILIKNYTFLFDNRIYEL